MCKRHWFLLDFYVYLCNENKITVMLHLWHQTLKKSRRSTNVFVSFWPWKLVPNNSTQLRCKGKIRTIKISLPLQYDLQGLARVITVALAVEEVLFTRTECGEVKSKSQHLEDREMGRQLWVRLSEKDKVMTRSNNQGSVFAFIKSKQKVYSMSFQSDCISLNNTQLQFSLAAQLLRKIFL